MPAPLRDIRVVDLSRVLAGPYCAQLLADMGAEVIKVESPQGDENRGWGVRDEEGSTCNFNSVNRGKRSIILDLKAPQAREVLARLVKDADVVVHSFLPGTAAKLGIEYETIRALNPDIIFCSISGFGEFGPLRDEPCYDLMMQAFSGVMSTTGVEGDPPVRSGVSFIDLGTGIIAYSGIVTALLNRAKGAGGAWVRASLLETAVSMLGYHAVAWMQAGKLPSRHGSGIPHLVPYQAFLCSDGYLLAGATNDLAWRRFCKAIGRMDLDADPRFSRNDDRLAHRSILVPILEVEFIRMPVAYWLKRFEAEGVAASAIQSIDQVMVHEQVLANDMVVSIETETGGISKLIGMPFKMSNYSGTAGRAAPRHGANTDDVLREIGLAPKAPEPRKPVGAT